MTSVYSIVGMSRHARAQYHAMRREGSFPTSEVAIHEVELSGRELLADMVRDGTPLDGQRVRHNQNSGPTDSHLNARGARSRHPPPP